MRRRDRQGPLQHALALEDRIRKTFEAINKLGETQRCEIAKAYLELRIEELRLVHEHAEKVQEEKDEQRRIREQLRDEEIARREIERAQQEAERDEQKYQAALERARAELSDASERQQDALRTKIAELEKRLAEAHENKERAISRAQLTRSGHVYVISNIGSFGEDVFKIGMTRRLDPMDRVRELGDASVPFVFDVHAIIYSEDAPALETKLHDRIWDHRVNMVNDKREFFRVGLEDIEAAVRECHGTIEFTRVAEAGEYRKTLAMRVEMATGSGIAPDTKPVEAAKARLAELSAVATA